MTTTKLPFELSEESTTSWLQSLSQLSSVNSANQINKVIKQLRAINTDADKIFRILIQLTPTVIYISTDIESSHQTESNKNANDKSRKVEKLCIQLLRSLSLAFYAFTTKKSFPDDEKNQCLYIALQLIGRTQRITAIFHQFPSTTLWKKTGEIFISAQNRNVFQQQIKHKIKDFKSLSTIEAVLKRNILFSIFAPYQQHADLIQELFSIAKQHAHLLNLNTTYTTENAFSWNINSTHPPYTTGSAQLRSDSIIGINTNELLSFTQSTSFSSSLKKEALEYIVCQISGYRELINSPVPSDFVINHLLVGFIDILEYLEETERLNKIQQISSQLAKTASSNYNLLNPVELKNNQFSLNQNTPNSSDNFLSEAEVVKILKIKNNQYLIAESNPMACSIGDLTLLCASNHPPELGIIRQIRITNASGTNHILIEKITGTPLSGRINAPETIENQIILIQTKKSSSEVFIATNKFSNGTLVKLVSEESFTLDKLIDHSPFYMRYQID